MMNSDWHVERIFLTVKAYPSFSKRHNEASCMAGITDKGKWIRLYPVPFRELHDEQKFKKYTWISVRVRKSSDPREESYWVDTDSIEPLHEVPTTGNWSQRNAIVLPKVQSGEEVFRDSRDPRESTLAIVKPREIVGLEIDRKPDEDFQKQVANLNAYQSQMNMFTTSQITPLELVPCSFRYEYIDDIGKRHKQKIVDWEIYQLYRKYKHAPNVDDIIRDKYITQLTKTNLHLFLGTMHQHMTSWIIIGVYYPTSTALSPNMFDS